MNIINFLLIALLTVFTDLAFGVGDPPASLSCKVNVTLTNGQTREKTFEGVEDVGGSNYLLARGVIALMDDNPLELYVFFNGGVSSINLSHHATLTYFAADGTHADTQSHFSLFARTSIHPNISIVYVFCDGVS